MQGDRSIERLCLPSSATFWHECSRLGIDLFSIYNDSLEPVPGLPVQERARKGSFVSTSRLFRSRHRGLVLTLLFGLSPGSPGLVPSRNTVAVAHGLPLTFEVNRRETDVEANIVGKTSSYTVLLTHANAVFLANDSVRLASKNNALFSGPRPSKSTLATLSRLELRFAGTNVRSQPEARNQQSFYRNYLIGNDPSRWRSHISQFAELRYGNIYPGIDLTYYGNGSDLEYDFVVSPRADPAQIRFSVLVSDRSSRVQVGKNGDLVIPSSNGSAFLSKPILYQGQACSVSKTYKTQPGCNQITGAGFQIQHHRNAYVVSFLIPRYDHTLPLIIDPAVVFSTYFGGSMGEGIDGMTVDAAGNIYVFGDTNSPDFPITTGSLQQSLAGDSDAFVSKLSPDGSQVLWSTYLGGSLAEFPKAIALDSAANVYVAGETYSTDFPLMHPFQTQNLSGAGFVSKLSPDGTGLIYSTYLTGTLETAANAIAIDSAGEAVVTGYTVSTDFPVANALQPNHAADNGYYYDAFLTKFSVDGMSLVFSTYLGGDQSDLGQATALDSSGNIYVAGITSSTDFPTTPGAYQPGYIADPWNSSFVSKFSASGSKLVYSTYLVDCQIFGIAVNQAGNAFVTGRAGWFAFPTTPGAFQTVQGGGSSTDAFVTELNSSGSSLLYSTFLGGNNLDVGNALVLDSSDNAYITGETFSPNFPLRSALQSTFYSGVPSVFASKLSTTGSALLFSTYWGGGVGGAGGQTGNAIAVDGTGNILIAGATDTADFPTSNAIQPQMFGLGDAFIAKFALVPDFSILGAPQSVTIHAGQAGKFSLSLAPLNGFAQQLSFTCLGAPPQASCSVAPAVLTLDGINVAAATVTVATTAQAELAGIYPNDELRANLSSSTRLGLAAVLSALYENQKAKPLQRSRWKVGWISRNKPRFRSKQNLFS